MESNVLNKKKILSLLLSLVMVFTAVSVAFMPTVYAAPGAGDYDALAGLIRELREDVRNTQFLPDVSGNNATYTDTTGDMLALADKYMEIYNGLIPTNWNNHEGTANGTATKINATIKTQMQSRFTSGELGTMSVNGLLDAMIANANVSSDRSTSNSLSTPERTLTITDQRAVMAYDSVEEMPDSIVTSVKYSFKHSRDSYDVTSGSGCSATTTTYYYLKANAATKADGASISTAPVKTLDAVLTSYAEYNGIAFRDLVAIDQATLETALADIGAAYTAVVENANFGEAVIVKYFAGLDIPAILADIQAAIEIRSYIEIAQYLQGKTTVDISGFTFDELQTLYFEMRQKLEDYNTAPATSRAFLEEEGYIVMADVDAKFEEIEDAYEILYLRDTLGPRIDADLAEYNTYDDAWTVATDGVEGILAAAELEMTSVLNDLISRKEKNVTAVFGANFIDTVFAAVYENFVRIREVNGYNLTFKQYQETYNSVFAPLTLEETDTQLYNILNSRDAWYTDLKAFADELAAYDAELAERFFDEAVAAMEAKIDSAYAALNAIVAAQIDDAYAIYETQKDEQGLAINEVNLATYNELQRSIGLINTTAYSFLKGTANFDIAAETVEKYEALKAIKLALDNYVPSQTLSAYDYNKIDLPNIIRYVNEKDVVRDRDFVVEDEWIEALADLLDEMLVGGGLADLGVELDLAATLDGLADTVYTDKFLNTIVGAIYPMLTDLVKEKISEVDGIGSLAGYIGLDDAFEKIDAAIVPAKVGVFVSNRGYTAIGNTLKAISGGMMDDTNPWHSSRANSTIWEQVLDEEGNLELDDEGEPKLQLNFDWGIDAAGAALEEAGDIAGAREARKAKFLNAANAGLGGLDRVFRAMLSYQAIPSTQVLNILIANASVSVTAMDGYNNTIVPLFEALGVSAEAIPDGRTFRNISDIIDQGLITPIRDLFAQLKTAPVDKVIQLLPNLAFAIQHGLFLPLLNNLVLDMKITGGGLLGGLIGNQAFGVVLGDALDFADLLGVETFYEDITSLDGVLNLVLGLLAGDEEEPAEGEEPAPALTLPHIDGAKLAMLGTGVNWAPSLRTESQIVYEGNKRVHANIVPNKPDVMVAIINYLLKAVGDENFLPAILNMINKDKAEDEQVALPEIVDTILASVRENGTDAVAAIYELIHPVYRYTMPAGIEWVTEGNIEQEDYDYWDEYAASVGQSYWTKDKAEYLQAHLEDFADDVITLFGESLGGAESIGEAVDYLLANLYKADTLNSLVETIRGLFGGIELPEMIAEMGLLEQLGLDLTAWDDMRFDFADGDKAAFQAGIVEILKPATPLLAFILAEKDISLTLLDKITVTAVGYDGYSYGLIPLLEAVGAKGVKSPAELQADPDNIVKNIVDPVFSLLDALADDPIAFIEDVLPGLLYFDKVGGVQVAIEHLLTAVQVLLDTIRPIYDIDIYQLAAENLGIDLRFAETDPINFLLGKLGEVIEDAGIPLQIDFTVESLSEKLHFTDPIEFTSKNGDQAYTIRLSEEGKADLLTTVLDYVVEEVAFGDNIEALMNYIEENLGLSEGIRTFIGSLLKTLKHVEADQPGLGKAILFWIFFGADSVTDASADFFVRYKEMEYKEIVISMLSSTADYIARAGFLMKEAYHDYSITEYNILIQMEEMAPVTTEVVNREFGAFYKFIQLLRKFVLLIRNTFKTIFGMA